MKRPFVGQEAIKHIFLNDNAKLILNSNKRPRESDAGPMEVYHGKNR